MGFEPFLGGVRVSAIFSLISAMTVLLHGRISSVCCWPQDRQDLYFVFDTIRIAFSYPMLTDARAASMEQDERSAME